MNVTPARSYLFVPGNRPERFEKARGAGADAVIVDLEDAVQPDEKGAACAAALAAPVDGVSTVFDDAQALEAEARRGRRFGYGGKLCIHPKQVAPVHRAYAWSDAQRAWAQRVLDAVQAGAGAAVALDGKMVDMPVILKARRILGV